ncbi:MAG: urease accessory protein UreF [Betaproteobacteria bacterium]|nr:MAG: urease accessory protein UreF [Betaproteobacteria bacterium]
MSAALTGPTLTLVRLLQLASPVLPIGAYSYSQGLESAIAHGEVRDAASAATWIGDMLELVVAPGEAAVLWRMLEALQREDWPLSSEWNDWFRTSRETAELRSETEQMGASLVRLAIDLDLLDPAAQAVAVMMAPVMLPAAFALAARGFGVPAAAALTAYIWSWLENQVLAAMKTIPLGQVAGQRMLVALGAQIPAAVTLARSIADEDMSTFAPGLAIASSRHETQYTRLFRS